MNWDEYVKEAMRTAFRPGVDPYVQARMGLVSEAGEVVGLFEKEYAQGVMIDPDKMCKELGDVLWYMALFSEACAEDGQTPFRCNLQYEGHFPGPMDSAKRWSIAWDAVELAYKGGPATWDRLTMRIGAIAAEFDLTLSQVAERNVEKLRARFPEAFSTELSVARDEEKE